MGTSDRKLIEILLVEDNPGDARLAMEVLKEAKVLVRLHHVEDGLAALAFLRQADRRHPDLVILDLNLPGMEGRQVLAEIKGDPGLRSIPVLVLTTSDAREDIADCYDLHANCYITKPLGLDDFIDVLRGIESFWFKIAALP